MSNVKNIYMYVCREFESEAPKKTKPAGHGTFAGTAHLCLHMTMYNCSTQYRTATVLITFLLILQTIITVPMTSIGGEEYRMLTALCAALQT